MTVTYNKEQDKKNRRTTTSPKPDINNNQLIITDRTKEIQQYQAFYQIDSLNDLPNKFNSLEEFKELIKDSFINGSGIAPELFAECVEFHADLEASPGMDAETPIHDALNWNFTRFGRQVKGRFYAALLKNEDGSIWQAVLSFSDEKGQRPYIYRSPVDNGDRVFLPTIPPSIRKRIASRYGVDVPMEGSFWEWFKTATAVSIKSVGAGDFNVVTAEEKPLQIPRIITEGAKKGLSLLTQGYVPLPLYGCSCGGRQALIPDLRQFNQDESIWLLALDRDSKEKTKNTVDKAKRELSNVLSVDGTVNYIEDIVWSPEQGKGVDDLIMNAGHGAFDNAYARALARLENQFKTSSTPGEDKPKKHRNLPPDEASQKIAEEYRHLLKFNNETKQWMRYIEGQVNELDPVGIWVSESNEQIESIVYKILKSWNAHNFGADYVTSVTKILRHELIEREWNEASPREWLPFRNGVVEIATGKLHEHSPGFKLTWQLPRNYSPLGGSWDTINNFLEHLAEGNPAIKEILICYCNAVIKGRYDLQRFLHLIGLGGTGKGTFSRLVTSLIGRENVHVTTLEDWCTNRFEGANAYRKRLVLFPDEDPYRGKIGKFLSLTGEDAVRAEIKGRTAFNFQYEGMVMVLSNHPVFSGGSASRAKRRTIPVACNKIVPETERRNLTVDFEPEISAFTNYLLTIPDDHVTSVIRGTKEVAKCTLEFWLNQMKGDSVASWLNDCLIYDPDRQTPIGKDMNEGANGTEAITLFGSYVKNCRATGDSPKSSKNFSPDLRELCLTVLGWRVEKKHTRAGEVMVGLRLRKAGFDDHIPTYEQHLIERVRSGEESVRGESEELCEKLEPLAGKGSERCEGLSGGSPVQQNIFERSLVTEPDNAQNPAPRVEQTPTFPDVCDEVIVNGFRLGEKVIITAHKTQPDWVDSLEEINGFGNTWVKFVSGRFAKFEHIRPTATPNTQSPSPVEEVVQEETDKFACPPLDDYYSRFPLKPYQFGVDTVFGTVKVTATPFKKIKSTGKSKIHFLFETPGKKAVETKEVLISKKAGISDLAKESSLIKKWEIAERKRWLKQVREDCVYRIKKLSLADNRDYDWVENCTLCSVPEPPASNHFIFKTPEGKMIPAAGVDEFEVMPERNQ